MTPEKEIKMKSRKKYKKKEVIEMAKRYQLTDIVKEAMSQGVIMEQMYGAEQDTLDMIHKDDPMALTTFILENIDNMRKHDKMLTNPNYRTRTVH
jgi:hypothetical protein